MLVSVNIGSEIHAIDTGIPVRDLHFALKIIRLDGLSGLRTVPLFHTTAAPSNWRKEQQSPAFSESGGGGIIRPGTGLRGASPFCAQIKIYAQTT